jgi:type IV secretory pathway TrbD component
LGSFTTILGYWTGLGLVAPNLDLPTLAGTALVMNVCNAITCRLIAAGLGRDPRTWMLAGFVGGIWAVGVLTLLPARTDERA